MYGLGTLRRVRRYAYERILENLPPEICIQVKFFEGHGRFADLRNPKTFSEKIQAIKLKDLANPDPRLPLLADKVRMKEVVAARLGPSWVVPTIWHGAELPEPAERKWPMPFVIKANHGSGWNCFVRSEQDLDWEKIESHCVRWLRSPFPWKYQEHWYNRIERQLLVEPLLGDGTRPPNDYKLFVCNGKVRYIQVDLDRFSGHRQGYFTPDWEKVPFSVLGSLDHESVSRPLFLDEMISSAEVLAEDFPFVRVDFYELDIGPVVGEITFAPWSGYQKFNPEAYDVILGSMLSLD